MLLSWGSLAILASFKQAPIGISTSLTSQAQDGLCPNVELSCNNKTVVDDLCCFNAPGGTLLLTEFWDTHPVTGPVDSWTLHGLWPDNCDGTYEANCDDRRAYRNIGEILEATGHSETLEYMRTYWKDYKGHDDSFWQHEWSKHGTCISTLNPSCFSDYSTAMEVGPFFDRAVALFRGLPTYEWLAAAGIMPSTTQTYTKAEIHDALSKNFGGRQVRLGCHGGELNEVWYFHNVRGSVQYGEFMPTDVVGSGSTCPSSGIKYLPKDSKAAPTTTREALPRPTNGPKPGNPFVGRGSLHVSTSNRGVGCLISGGAWYSTGTCASFTATKDGDMFSLKSSKGNCGVVNGDFVCGRGAKVTLFEASGNKLLFNGSDIFYADELPSGRKRSTVFVNPGHDLELKISWHK